MSGNAIALPRLRVRRRKPPHPRTVHEFLWALGALVVIGKTLLIYFTTGKLNEVRLGLFVLFFVFARRNFLMTRDAEHRDLPLRPVARWEWALLTFLWVGIAWPPW